MWELIYLTLSLLSDDSDDFAFLSSTGRYQLSLCFSGFGFPRMTWNVRKIKIFFTALELQTII